MKIKFNSDDNLSLNKMLKLHMLTVIVRSAYIKREYRRNRYHNMSDVWRKEKKIKRISKKLLWC